MSISPLPLSKWLPLQISTLKAGSSDQGGEIKLYTFYEPIVPNGSLTICYNTNGGTVNRSGWKTNETGDVYYCATTDGNGTYLKYNDYESGRTYVQPLSQAELGLDRPGYAFVGWKAVSGSGKVFQGGAKCAVVDIRPEGTNGEAGGDISVYFVAQWEPLSN